MIAIAALWISVLLIGGDQDPVVPITAVNEWADTLRARDVIPVPAIGRVTLLSR